MRRVIVGASILVGVAVVFLPRVSDDAEVSSGGEVEDRRASGDIDRPDIRLDADNIPPDLRDLIPFAEEWGIGDDVIRSDVEEAASDEEKRRFSQALRGRTDRVTEWLDSFGMELMSDEAAAFMYMLSALDEMGVWPD